MSVVTISAAYGTGGRLIGAEVARRLGLRFVDEVITAALAEHFVRPVREVAAHETQEPSFWGHFAPLAGLWCAPGYSAGPLDDDQAYRTRAEQMIREFAACGAVVIGRGGALVLADRGDALHVRLDGPAEARIAQAVEIGGLDERTARRRQKHVDRAREHYVRHYYHADITDPRHFDLVIDATSLPLATCVEVIIAGASNVEELERIGVCAHRLRRTG